MPVWFVIVRYMRHPSMYPIYQILKVIPGNFEEDYHAIWEKEVVPLQALGTQIGEQYQIMYFTREVDNPFKEKANER